MKLHTYHTGETLAGVSERRLQALISKRGGRGIHAKAELEASFKAVRDAAVCCGSITELICCNFTSISDLVQADAVQKMQF